MCKRNFSEFHSAKIFAAFRRREARSTDGRMRDAISWDPCGSGDEIEFHIFCYFEIYVFFIMRSWKYYVISIITSFLKMFVVKIVICNCNNIAFSSERYQQRQNPLVYMICIYAILNLQFSNMVVFGCFVSGVRLCCCVLAHISCDKSTTRGE